MNVHNAMCYCFMTGNHLSLCFSFADKNAENYEWLNKQLDVCEEERNLLVNTPIHPSLMYTILEFVYQDEYQESVPPMLRPSSGISQNGQESSQVSGDYFKITLPNFCFHILLFHTYFHGAHFSLYGGAQNKCHR